MQNKCTHEDNSARGTLLIRFCFRWGGMMKTDIKVLTFYPFECWNLYIVQLYNRVMFQAVLI